MKTGLPFKLGVAVLAVFALLVAGLLLYNPIRFRIYGIRLKSKEKKTVKDAKRSVLDAGRKSIPYIRAWLKDREIISEACKIIMAIKEDYWKETLPELENLLDTYPDGYSLRAAEILTEKGGYDYKIYIKHPLRQICLLDYSYRTTEDIKKAEGILKKINEIQHPESVLLLVRTLESNFHRDLKERAIKLLGLRKDPRYKEILIDILKESDSADLRIAAVYALSRYGNDGSIVDLLLDVLQNDKNKNVRLEITSHLSIYKDSAPKIISTLSDYIDKEQDEYTRSSMYITLGWIGGEKAISLLFSRLEKEHEADCIYTIFEMLISDENEKILLPLLEKAKNTKNIYIKLLLAWNFGGQYLEKDLYKNSRDPKKWFMMLACARWGDIDSLRIAFVPQSSLEFSRYHRRILLMLPEDIRAQISDIDDLIGLPEHYPMLKKWYYENRHKLVWNSETCKYEYTK